RLWERMEYASALSEFDPTVDGADRGLAVLDRAREDAMKAIDTPEPSPDSLNEAAYLQRNWATLRLWRWQLSGNTADLSAVIQALEESLALAERLRAAMPPQRMPIGILAELNLRLLLLRRAKEDDRDRTDIEKHVARALAVKANGEHRDRHRSYLH